MNESEIARILVAKYEKTATRNEEALLEEWMTLSKANRIFVENKYYARAEKKHSRLFTRGQSKIRDEFEKLMGAVYRARANYGSSLEQEYIGEIARLILLELKKDILPPEKAALRKWVNSDPNHKIMYQLLMENQQKRIGGLLAQFLLEQKEILTGEKRDLIMRKYEELRTADDNLQKLTDEDYIDRHFGR
jgi:hypothetical protein